MDARTHLINRLDIQNGSVAIHPLVTLEEYFPQNHEETSIGSTGKRDFTPKAFYGVLIELRASDYVYDIRVELDSPKSPEGWPSTETIWIVSSLSRAEFPRSGLSQQFWAHYLPDDWLSFPRIDGRRTEELTIPDGHYAFGFWYA